MIENVCVIAINISEIKDVTYIFVQYVVLYDGPEAYMYEIKLCYVILCYVMLCHVMLCQLSLFKTVFKTFTSRPNLRSHLLFFENGQISLFVITLTLKSVMRYPILMRERCLNLHLEMQKIALHHDHMLL